MERRSSCIGNEGDSGIMNGTASEPQLRDKGSRDVGYRRADYFRIVSSTFMRSNTFLVSYIIFLPP